jgi:xanthine/CO dehydrogenase XdhC/CoxF family maturation factor
MSDLKDLVRAAADIRRKEKELLVATVVRVRGSSYRRAGARILLAEDRWIAGSVTGDRLERDVVRKGWWNARENAPVLVTHDSASEDGVGWSVGLGYNGVLDVLLERVGPRTLLDPIAFIERCVRHQKRGSIATVFRSASRNVHVGARIQVIEDGPVESTGLPAALHHRLVADCRRSIASSSTLVHTYDDAGSPVEALVESIVPPPRLFLFAAGQDAAPVANLARAVGWDVFVCVAQANDQTRERFAVADAIVVTGAGEVSAMLGESDRALVVVMNHDYERDKRALAVAMRSPARYIGVHGPRRRTAKLLAELGYAIDGDPRVHAPVGLAIGAETPQEVALSVIAEAKAILTGNEPSTGGVMLDVQTSTARDRANGHLGVS